MENGRNRVDGFESPASEGIAVAGKFLTSREKLRSMEASAGCAGMRSEVAGRERGVYANGP